MTRDAIRRTAAVLAPVLALLAGLAPLATGEGGGEKKGPVPLADLGLLHGPWDGGPAHRESVFFVQAKRGGRPAAKLLFDAERVLAVRDANGKHTYEAGKDFLLSADCSTLTLPPGSRVPFRQEAELYLVKGSPHSIGHRRGQPGTSLLFGEGHFFHDQQVEVSYAPRKGTKWAGHRPAFAGKLLPKTIELLRKKMPLTLSVSGDSISQGYNASGFTKAPPFLPPYPELVARQDVPAGPSRPRRPARNKAGPGDHRVRHERRWRPRPCRLQGDGGRDAAAGQEGTARNRGGAGGPHAGQPGVGGHAGRDVPAVSGRPGLAGRAGRGPGRPDRGVAGAAWC